MNCRKDMFTEIASTTKTYIRERDREARRNL